MNRPDPTEATTPTAYERVGWRTFSPYMIHEIDELARQYGVTLHVGTDEETLRRFINIYRSGW